MAHKPRLIDFHHQRRGGIGRAAIGGGVDQGKRVKKRVDQIDDQQEKCGRGQERKDDCPKPAGRAGAIDGGRLDQGAGDRLQPGKEKQEVIRNLFPGCRNDHQDQRLVAIHVMVPFGAR